MEKEKNQSKEQSKTKRVKNVAEFLALEDNKTRSGEPAEILQSLEKVTPDADAPDANADADALDANADAPDANADTTSGTHAVLIIDLYVDDGEGIMNGSAETVEELGLKHGSKRSSNPANWKVNKKKRET